MYVCKGYELFYYWKSNEIRDVHASVLQADMNQVFSKKKKKKKERKMVKMLF